MIDSFRGEYAWLSNFHVCPVTHRGFAYRSAEHAYQAAKAQTGQDRAYVADAPTAAKAKARGREIGTPENWNNIKLATMREIVYAKFCQNAALAIRLASTGDIALVEGNRWNDTYWGVCNGVGENHLGKILMELRADIQEALAWVNE
jgi:ribA/ribD-fused uncharacterized protein